MTARLLRWLDDRWYRRPVIIRHSTLTDIKVDQCQSGYERGRTAGLAESIAGKRVTSTGRTLVGIPGGVA